MKTYALPLALLLAACTREPRPVANAATPDRPTQRDPAPTPAPAAPTQAAPTPMPTPTPAPVPATPTAPASLEAQRAMAAASNALGVDVYRRLATAPGNLALSPASISVAFGMTAAGAGTETLAQMRRVLHHKLPPAEAHAALGTLSQRWNIARDGFTLATANRLFGHAGSPFEDAFVALTRDRYGAPLERVDFTNSEPARVHINRWVAGQTRDRIADLLPPRALDGLTRLVLVNALYLDARWRRPFEANRTRPGVFYAPTGEVQVPRMSAVEEFAFAERDGVKVLEMAYRGGDFVMDVILPDARDGLGALESRLSAEQLAAWCEGLRPQRVAVTLPRFRIAGDTVPLRETMLALGMTRAFDRTLADFLPMSNPPSPAERLYIASAFHKVFVEVNEAGTEAAAATAVVMAARGGMMPQSQPASFVADHPFLFVLRERETGAVLFLGRVNNPQ